MRWTRRAGLPPTQRAPSRVALWDFSLSANFFLTFLWLPTLSGQLLYCFNHSFATIGPDFCLQLQWQSAELVSTEWDSR